MSGSQDAILIQAGEIILALGTGVFMLLVFLITWLGGDENEQKKDDDPRRD